MTVPTRVLVVDADGEAAARTAARLERSDVAVDAVVETDAERAVERLAETDCVVTEQRLEGTTGLALLERVRERRPDLPVVVYTAHGDEGVASRAAGAGATDYVVRAAGDGDEDEDDLPERVRAAVAAHRERTRLERTEARYRRLVDQNLVGTYIIQNGRFEYVNERMARVFGYEREEMVGMAVGRVVDDDDYARVEQNIHRRLEADVDDLHYTLVGEHRTGRELRLEVHGGSIEYDDEPAVMGTLIDRTLEHRRTAAMSALNEALRDLLRSTDAEDVVEVAVDHATSALGLPATAVYRHDDGRLRPTAATETAREAFGDPLPTFGPADGRVWDAYESGDLRGVEEVAGLGDGMGSVVAAPLADHGLLVTAPDTPDKPDQTTVELVRLLAASVGAALDRADHEARLSRLHDATRQLMSAKTAEEVASVATDAAHDVLGLDVNAVFLVSDDGEALEPVSVTEAALERLPELSRFEPGSSLAWRAYTRNEPQVYDDVRTAPVVQNPETTMRSELILPLGNHGVFVAGSPVAGEFDESLVSLAKVFGANIEAALDRADRESRLRDREAELERQNEHLDAFASAVSHDLRNPLSVASGHVELLDADGDHVEAIEDAHDRMRTLIENVLTLSRHGRRVGNPEPVDLRLAVSEAWATVDGGALDAPPDLGTVDADPERLGVLLSNLFGNAVSHGGEDVTVTVGRLDDDDGFFVADDGRGLPADERETLFEAGVTTDEDGTGFGLTIVESIAEAHGWEVRATESETGGARFEVRLDEPRSGGEAERAEAVD